MTDLDEVMSIMNSVQNAVGQKGYRQESLIVAMTQVIIEIVESAEESNRKEIIYEVIAYFTTHLINKGIMKES